MRVLVLNRFNLGSTRYRAWADPGTELVMLTDDAGLSGDPATRAGQLSGYRHVEVFADYDDNPAVEDYCLSRFAPGDFDGLLAMSEPDILRAARIREALAIPGQGVESATAYRDKLRMKELCAARGVPIAGYAGIPDVAALHAFAAANGYPLVVKPRRESASIGVEVIRSSEELSRFAAANTDLRSQNPAPLLAEQYIEHELYHVDGLVVGGKLAWSWTSRMTSLLGPDFVPERSTMLAPGDPLLARSRALVESVVEALPTPELAIIHAELFDSPGRGLVFNEIASRVGGGKIHAMLRAAFGVGLIEWYIRESTRAGRQPLPAGLPDSLAGYAMLRPQPGIFRSAPRDCPLPRVDQYQLIAEPGERLSRAQDSSAGIATFVVLGADPAGIGRTLDAAQEWFTANAVIEPE
jgi:biotin carboxylase